MDPSKTLVDFSALPTECWRVVTSFLGLYTTMCLVKASNKLLRLKLLRQGGVHRLQLALPLDSSKYLAKHTFAPYKWTFDDSGGPTVVVPPPPGFFRMLTSLAFGEAVGSTFSYDGVYFPPSLTHLDLLGGATSILFRPIDAPERFKSSFTNLLHLRVKDDLDHGFKATSLLSSLPDGLQTLCAHFIDAHAILNMPEKLPQTLTYLNLVQITQDVVDLSSQHLQAILPHAITRLELPGFRLATPSWGFGPAGQHISSLHLHSVKRIARPALPASLTQLSLVHEYPKSEVDKNTDWPRGLQSLCVSDTYSDPLPGTPSATYLRFSELNSPWNSAIQISQVTQTFRLSSANLVWLDIPRARFNEFILDVLPASLTRLDALDVFLDGSSLPHDLETLNGLNDCKRLFWSKRRSFALFLLAHNAPTAISDQQFILPDSLRTLSLESSFDISQNHKQLPPALTSLSNLLLSPMALSKLPKTLTHLHFVQRKYAPAVDVFELLDQLPSLREMAALPYSPNADIRPATLKLGPTYFPTPQEVAEMCTEDSSKPSPVLLLPNQAIQKLHKLHRSALELTGFSFDATQLCSKVTTIEAAEAKFIGRYVINATFNEGGFAYGMHTLDITNAEFCLVQTVSPTMPRLPATLTKLSLGGAWAYRIISHHSNSKHDFSTILPFSLTHLKLTLEVTPPRRTGTSLAPGLPEGIGLIEVLQKGTYLSLKSVFTNAGYWVRESQTDDGHRLEATKSAPSDACLIM